MLSERLRRFHYVDGALMNKRRPVALSRAVASALDSVPVP